MITLTPEGHAGSREQAQSLTIGLAADLTGQTVAVDCASLVVSSPSFFDELVKQVLIERHANELIIDNAGDRLLRHAERSAANRNVSHRLRVGGARAK